MIPAEELRFYRLIEERRRRGKADCYTLACGHIVIVSPAYPDVIRYLPCPRCVVDWYSEAERQKIEAEL